MTLGQKVRQARIRAGLTQEQAAGGRITRNMLSLIENDLSAPSMKTLEYLAAALGVTAGWLLADDASDEAAERLEKLCQLEKWGVSIETQGALGTENRLADEDIRRADVALLITDIELAGAERFEHCRYVQCSIYAFLREPQRVMSAVRKVLSAPQQTHLILE